MTCPWIKLQVGTFSQSVTVYHQNIRYQERAVLTVYVQSRARTVNFVNALRSLISYQLQVLK